MARFTKAEFEEMHARREASARATHQLESKDI